MFGKHFNDVDLFVFPDIFHADLQDYLVGQGKRVWGARYGEELETEREASRTLLAKLGLPVAPWRAITGLDKVRDYLKANKDKYVKLSFWRGTFETIHADKYTNVESKLDEIQVLLGKFAPSTTFMIEDPVPDAVEIGMDAYTIDGRYPSRMLSGIEIKDKAYVGAFHKYDQFPKPLLEFNEKLSPILRNYGYRGFESYETRMVSPSKGYMIDFCARCGSPPSELYSEFYTNLSEIVYAGADGELVEPEPIAKFGAWCIIESAWADKNWQSVDFPAKHRQNIKLRNAVRIDGRYYAVPQAEGLTSAGAVVGWGDTLDKAMEQVKEVAQSIEGYGISVPTAAFDDAQGEIEQAKKMGVTIFDAKGKVF